MPADFPGSLPPSMPGPVGTVHFIAAKTRRKLVQTLGAASSQTSATRPAVGSSELHLAAPSCARHTVCIAEPEAELRLHPGWGAPVHFVFSARWRKVKCLSTSPPPGIPRPFLVAEARQTDTDRDGHGSDAELHQLPHEATPTPAPVGEIDESRWGSSHQISLLCSLSLGTAQYLRQTSTGRNAADLFVCSSRIMLEKANHLRPRWRPEIPILFLWGKTYPARSLPRLHNGPRPGPRHLS